MYEEKRAAGVELDRDCEERRDLQPRVVHEPRDDVQVAKGRHVDARIQLEEVADGLRIEPGRRFGRVHRCAVERASEPGEEQVEPNGDRENGEAGRHRRGHA